MIKAEVHSDDHAVEVDFDATLWFEQATEKQIEDLAITDFRFDYPSDDVAIFMAEHNEEIAGMFKYIEIRGRVETMGFGCSVEEDDAMKWIEANKPNMFELIKGE